MMLRRQHPHHRLTRHCWKSCRCQTIVRGPMNSSMVILIAVSDSCSHSDVEDVAPFFVSATSCFRLSWCHSICWTNISLEYWSFTSAIQGEMLIDFGADLNWTDSNAYNGKRHSTTVNIFKSMNTRALCHGVSFVENHSRHLRLKCHGVSSVFCSKSYIADT